MKRLWQLEQPVFPVEPQLNPLIFLIVDSALRYGFLRICSSIAGNSYFNHSRNRLIVR